MHDKKQDIYIILEYLPKENLLFTNGKIVTLQWRNLADITLAQ